jgi:glycerol-3-phosphate O-acyltransferase
MDRAELERSVSGLLAQLGDAYVHLPRNNRDYAVEVGVRHLAERGIVIEKDGLFHTPDAQRSALAYYANSIRHLVPKDGPVLSADAKEISATAGS